MCKYSHLSINEEVLVDDPAARCHDCEELVPHTGVEAIYKGHMTCGDVYDVFAYKYPRMCPSCKNIKYKIIVPCDSGANINCDAFFEKIYQEVEID